MSFISNAIQFQKGAGSIFQAEKSLSISCRMCSERGIMHCDCERCPIQHAHNTRVETLRIMREMSAQKH